MNAYSWKKCVKFILVWGCLFLLMGSGFPIPAQQFQSSKIRVELNVGGHEKPKSILKDLFRSELQSLRDVLLVEKNPTLQIKIDGMETEVNRFLVSIIVLNANNEFLANDLGFATNSQDLKEIAQKIVSQVNEIYLSPLRNAKHSAASKKKLRNTIPSQQTYSALGQHWVLEKMEQGRFIKLEDNSLWEISPYDRSNTHLWLPYEEIFIIESEDENYPYHLMNKNNEDTASAKLIAH